MMDGIVGVVMVTTVMFSDGTPPEQKFIPQASIVKCVQHASDALLKMDPPVRDHPIKFYSVTCAVGTDAATGLPKRKP